MEMDQRAVSSSGYALQGESWMMLMVEQKNVYSNGANEMGETLISITPSESEL